MTTYTRVVAEVVEPSLGVFKALAPKEGDPKAFRFVLSLDFFQSNCYRQWLDLRWQAASLEGVTLFLEKSNSLLIIKDVDLEVDQSASKELEVWRTFLMRHFKLYVSSRR